MRGCVSIDTLQIIYITLYCVETVEMGGAA